jgi:hypothetical protein
MSTAIETLYTPLIIATAPESSRQSSLGNPVLSKTPYGSLFLHVVRCDEPDVLRLGHDIGIDL